MKKILWQHMLDADCFYLQGSAIKRNLPAAAKDFPCSNFICATIIIIF